MLDMGEHPILVLVYNKIVIWYIFIKIDEVIHKER